jgi:predicted metal-dependent hydrolase
MAIKVSQIIRTKRKTIALIIQPDGSLVVRAPFKAKTDQIQSWVTQKADWILKKQAEIKAKKPPPSPHRYFGGEIFYFLGKAYPLKLSLEVGKGLAFDGVFTLSAQAVPIAGKLFKAWYRQQAGPIMEERTRTLAQRFGFQYQQVKITSAMTRWGSCSARGVINFSWRLVMAPVEVIDNVVIHELVHTQVRNHSQEFWARVQALVPDYKTRAGWLKRNACLMRID